MRSAIFFVLGVTLLACSSQPGGNNDGGTSNNDSGSTNKDSAGNPNGGPITFPAQCPALNACGGAVDGTWDYTNGCIDDPFADVKKACAMLEVKNAMGTVKGTVTFSSGMVTRSGSASVSATLVFPSSCTFGAPCSTIQANLPPGSTCTGTTECTCNVTKTDSISDVDTYTVQGTKIVTGDGSEYSYCVSGSSLKYTEGGANPKHRGVFDLAKR